MALNLPPGWRMNPSMPDVTQEEADQFIDTYYRTGPGANLGAGDYGAQTGTGVWDPKAAASGKASYMEEHPDFETNPFVPGADKKKSRQAMIDALSPNLRTGIESAFTAYGADPKAYASDIESSLAATLAGIPADVTDFDKYFADKNLGSSLISSLEPGYRSKAKTAFGTAVPTDFFADTADDALIESILNTDRTAANEFVNNMLSRGQITETGKTAALADLDKQGATGKTRLNEIGAGLMNTEEGNFAKKRGEALTGYDTLKLGQAYDPAKTATDLTKLASDFIAGLTPTLRSGLGATPLFSTSGLGAIAGSAQGGQNTAFTPAGGTTAGTPATQTLPDEDEPKTQQNVLF